MTGDAATELVESRNQKPPSPALCPSSTFFDGLPGVRENRKKGLQAQKAACPTCEWEMTDGVWRMVSGTRKQAPISTSKNTSTLHVASGGLAGPPAVSRLLGQQLGHSAARRVALAARLSYDSSSRPTGSRGGGPSGGRTQMMIECSL